ncbi:hypothetical protein SLS53_006625 [Cytospora paraplurivora]|uniref:O-methyltransferase n=1 Tax=Cytospora paraplurivora TaxID=2898453 RepID=A0AAN9YD71_9PEZI
MAATVTEYCTAHSDDTSAEMKQLWDWTYEKFDNMNAGKNTADKMSSPLQGATNKFLAELLKPKRNTQAEIITLELDEEMIQAAKRNLSHFGIGDRVKLVEGPAQATIPTLTGHFDLIFVDANKDGYQGYVKQILDLKLLSPGGVILCDNVFARGMTISTEANPSLPQELRPYWTECGKALDRFNKFCKNEPRIDTIMLPVYDGLTLIKWKTNP